VETNWNWYGIFIPDTDEVLDSPIPPCPGCGHVRSSALYLSGADVWKVVCRACGHVRLAWVKEMHDAGT